MNYHWAEEFQSWIIIELKNFEGEVSRVEEFRRRIITELKNLQKMNYHWVEEIWSKKDYTISWAYDRLQVSDHSLGGYSHRERWARTQWKLSLNALRNDTRVTPIGSEFFRVKLTQIFLVRFDYEIIIKIFEFHYHGNYHWDSRVVLSQHNSNAVTCHVGKTPGPSCVARYTQMDALCWFKSVSTTRRKSWWMHWVPWEPLGLILCKS
jgi:hypothetical protein